MTSFFDKLNLRPQERRLVVGITVVVIIVLNYLFVWPYFFEWQVVDGKMETAKANIKKFQDEIQRDLGTNGYKSVLAKMEQQGGAVRLESDIQLQKTIMTQASAAHVIINSQLPVAGRSAQTNELFEEQATQITIDAGESELIDFLYQIGGDSSMIRVRELNLRPADANRYRLRGTITLSATYQKKSETKAAPVTPKPSGKPTLTPQVKKPAPPVAPAPAK